MNIVEFDNRSCTLGEGPLWHPLRQQMFWFDIVNCKLLTSLSGAQSEWQFDECVSAAGWIDNDTLLMATESGLYRFDLSTGDRSLLVKIEADNPVTRSNDGRADPWGGFWIGTMGKQLETGAGAIYRFYDNRVQRLYDRITVPNAICFSPDSEFAYFTDTFSRQIMRQKLGAEGWPEGEAETLIDLRSEKLNPDGAVTDKNGNIWNAQWGASRVACYAPTGEFLEAVTFPASQTSCPAFGGKDLSTLFVTSASENMDAPAAKEGRTFSIQTESTGLPEPQVKVR